MNLDELDLSVIAHGEKPGKNLEGTKRNSGILTEVESKVFTDDEIPEEELAKVADIEKHDDSEVDSSFSEEDAKNALVNNAVQASEKATMNLMEMKSASDIGSLDLKQVAEEVDNMNYLQLRATKKQMESNLGLIEMYHSMYDQFSKMAGDVTDVAAKVNLSHQLDNSGIDQDVETFYNEYSDVKANIEAVLEVLNPKLAEYDEMAKSTTFLTEQMLQSIESRIKAVSEGENPNTYTLECFEELKNIYGDRTHCIEYLKNYRRDLRKMKKMARTESRIMMNRVQADLESKFQATSLGAFEQYLVKTWGGDSAAEDAAIVCLGMLAKSMETDKYLSHGENAKIFIMNGLDVLAGIWDVEGCDADSYTEKVKELFDTYRIDNESVS